MRHLDDDELQQLMKPRLDALRAFTVPAGPASDVGRKNGGSGKTSASRSDGPNAESKPGKAPEEKPETLLEEEAEYLESILERPNLTVTQRRDALGLSTYKNDRVKKALLAKGMVVEVPVNLGFETRGIVKLLEVTNRGYQALGKTPPQESRLQGSPKHRFWQRNIAHFYRKQGFKAEIEMCLNGKRADVGFIKDGLKVAVEVGLTAKNEVVNVQKDLEAGFDRVLVACRDAKVRKAVEENLQRSVSPEKLQRVKLILLSDFSFVKELLGK